MDQLRRALEAEGLDMTPLEGSLAASSLPGRITVFILRIVRTLDIFFDGMIADALKVMLIELFSDEAFLEQSLRQFGEGFARVLIEQRNQVVVDDLKVIVENEPNVRTLPSSTGQPTCRIWPSASLSSSATAPRASGGSPPLRSISPRRR